LTAASNPPAHRRGGSSQISARSSRDQAARASLRAAPRRHGQCLLRIGVTRTGQARKTVDWSALRSPIRAGVRRAARRRRQAGRLRKPRLSPNPLREMFRARGRRPALELDKADTNVWSQKSSLRPTAPAPAPRQTTARGVARIALASSIASVPARWPLPLAARAGARQKPVIASQS